jgi:hypothetical protein
MPIDLTATINHRCSHFRHHANFAPDDKTEEAEEPGKSEFHRYDGAGHAFFPTGWGGHCQQQAQDG